MALKMLPTPQWALLLALAAPAAAAETQAPAMPAQAEAAPGAPIPLEHFIDPESFGSIKISPDGAHYAATVPMDDRTLLVILRRADNKQTAIVALEKKGHIHRFSWVNPRQVVYSVATRHGPLDHPVANPFLYIVDVDGNPRSVARSEEMYLLDPLRLEDDEILVGFTGRHRYGVGRVDLRTGRVTAQRGHSPLHSETLYVDNAGDVRLSLGYIAQETLPRLYLRNAEGKWVPVNIEKETGERMYVSGFSGDNRLAYLLVERRDGPDEYASLDLETLERKPLLRNPRVDVYTTLHSPLDGGVSAVVFLDGKPTLEYLRPDDPHARELKKLARAFPGSYVFPTSYTLDGQMGVYFVSSDVNSGEYYLVDHARGKADFIAAASDKLDPASMSPMRPFRFKARDGLEMEGFLTVPRSWLAGRPGPLVVMPHGGPKGVFDTWGFDHEVQMLASRGYAVLQLNFRGSGNYGRAFREAGDRQWGRKMQDDLTDATRWAIAEGVAAPGRICLYGASYGAYASMMGLVREPDLYACGIGNVGVYDLPQLYREETTGSRYAQVTLDEMLGGSGLAEISPPRLAASIRVPVLLGAGGDDGRAPPHHTRTMRRALENAGVPVEAVIYENEGHGYYDKANRVDWARRVLAMLDKTIGPGRPGATASP